MALAVDEYGGLQGIVTQTNLLEAITGDLPDTENPDPEVKELADGALLVDGAMSIYDAQVRLDPGTLPAGDFSTLAGFVLCLLGRLPSVREHIDWEGWRFEVREMDGGGSTKYLQGAARKRSLHLRWARGLIGNRTCST